VKLVGQGTMGHDAVWNVGRRIVQQVYSTIYMASSERTNEQWVAELAEPGEAQEIALSDLRAIVMRGLPYALSKWLKPSDPQFDSLSEEVAQDTLLRVLDSLHSFEGRSKFTTWVHKIAVRIALTELRRKRWRDVSLDQLTEDAPGEGPRGILAAHEAGPDMVAEQSDMIEHLQRVISEELTEKQREALIATRIHGMPMEEVARRMGTNRNALYKLLHDARQRLKARLEEEGLSPEDVLAAFEIG
jgi:RNA polymerase sigma-70 factor (ECF subfamily)